MQSGILNILNAATVQKEVGVSLIGQLKNSEAVKSPEKAFEPEVKRQIKEQEEASKASAGVEEKSSRAYSDYDRKDKEVDPEVLEVLAAHLPDAIIDFLKQLNQVAPATSAGEGLSPQQLAQMIAAAKGQGGDLFDLPLSWMEQNGFADLGLTENLSDEDAQLLAGLLGIEAHELALFMQQFVGNEAGFRQEILLGAQELGVEQAAFNGALARALEALGNPQQAALILPEDAATAAAFFKELQFLQQQYSAGNANDVSNVAAKVQEAMNHLPEQIFAVQQTTAEGEDISAKMSGYGMFAAGKQSGQLTLTGTTSDFALSKAWQIFDAVQQYQASLQQPVVSIDMARSFAIGAAEEGHSVATQDAEALSATGQLREAAANKAGQSQVSRPTVSAENSMLIKDQLVVQISQAAQKGQRQVRIQLDPPEMGRVTINMELGQDGKTQLVISSDNKDTLNLLQRDSRELAQALNELGLEADANEMEFSLEEQGGDGYETAARDEAGLNHGANDEVGTNSANSGADNVADVVMDNTIIEALMDQSLIEMSESEREILADFALLRGAEQYGKQRMLDEQLNIEV